MSRAPHSASGTGTGPSDGPATPDAALLATGVAPSDCLVCVAGKNDIACDVLRHLAAELGTDRLVVVPNADDPGHATWQQSLRQTAARLGVRQVTLADVYPVENLLLLSLEFNELLRPARFATKRLFNVHFSLLPRYKGMYTSIWPILNDERESGATLHYIDRGIDTGHVIAQQAFPIAPDDTSRDVYFNYLRTAYRLVVDRFDDLLHDRQQGRAQPVDGSTYYSRATIDFSKPAVVDFRATAHQVRNYVRAYAFPEYQMPIAHDHAVYRAEPLPVPSVGRAGTVVRDDDTSMVVHTIDYDVRLLKDHSRALLDAVARGDLAEVRRLAPLTHDLDAANRRGWSALMIAGWNGHDDIARVLVEHGASVNRSNRNGTSVLMYAKDGAARSGDGSLLDYLISRGADAGARDDTGRSVADYCRANAQPELAAYFEGAARSRGMQG